MVIYKNCPFPVRSPPEGGSMQTPLCPPPRPVLKVMGRTKKIRKEMTKEKKQKKIRPRSPYSSPAEAMDEGVEKNNG
jgi:hypothetical protein